MTIETQLNQVLDKVLSGHFETSVTTEQLIHCIDLTLLDEQASDESLQLIRKKAKTSQVAAVCVLTQHLHHFSADTIPLATVVNFPQGTDTLQQCQDHIDKAKQLGAKEIDYVLPYQSYLAGNTDDALARCKAIVHSCKKNNLTLKIILETGAFPNMQSIYQISRDLIDIGCNFLKTSTGKIPQGANLTAVLAILTAIKDSNSTCGVKVSGGIKTPQQALNYAHFAELIIGKKITNSWFRIGASSLLDELLLLTA